MGSGPLQHGKTVIFDLTSDYPLIGPSSVSQEEGELSFATLEVNPPENYGMDPH